MKSNKEMKLGLLKKHLESLTKNLNKMLEPFKDVFEKLNEKIKKDENDE